MPEQNDKMTFRDKVRIFFRWRYLFWISAAALAAILLIVAHEVPLEYSASAKLESRVSPTLPEQALDGVTGSERLEQIRRTLVQGMSGREIIAAVAEDMGMFEDIDANEDMSDERRAAAKNQIVASIQSNLDIRWDVQSREVDLVSVSYTSSDPDLAYKIPNLLVLEYTQATKDDTLRELGESMDFLNRNVTTFKAAMDAEIDKKIALETEYVGLVEHQQLDIVRRMIQAKADRDAVMKLLNIARGKLTALNAIKETQEQDVDELTEEIRAPNPELERLGAELREYKVELDLAMTLQHMTREHPAIQTLLRRIAIMEERIRNTPEWIIIQQVYGTGAGAEEWAARVAASQAEVEILGAELDRVEAQIEGYEKMMASFEDVRGVYSKILESIEDLQTKVDFWEHRRRQVDMAYQAEKDVTNQRTQILPVEQAQRPYLPSFPALPHVLVVTYLGALAFGGLVVFFWNSKDRTFSTTEQAARAFDVPVIGAVGEIKTTAGAARQKTWRWVVAPIITAVIVIILALLTLSITLKLRHPRRYKQWRDDPAGFISKSHDNGPDAEISEPTN